MPEGDTIHRTADRMRPALAGHVLAGFDAPRLVGDRPTIGVSIDDVEARGKHLLIHFGDGISLRTHMKMTGSWHLYRTGERWRKGAHLARAVVEADNGWIGVCFAAPVVETYHRSLGDPAPLAGLGPDLCRPDPDIDAALHRFVARCEPTTEIADALLDQGIASGIGNVYKSECLFLCGIDPFRPASVVDESDRRRLLELANRLLLANLDRSQRVTYQGGLAVYGRNRQPCRRCGSVIQMRRQGPMARSTYWCPSCQPSAVA